MIKKIGHKLKRHSEYFLVNWGLGNICNFKCTYCTPILNNGEKKWVPLEKVIEFADKVIFHYSQMNKKIVFQFTGGEVTLNKDLIKILKHLKERGCITEILSNGGQHLSYWESLVEVLDFCNLSFHADHCNQEHFFEVINLLQKHISLNVNIMLHPKHFEDCVDFGNKICASFPDVFVSYQPLMKSLTSSKDLVQYTSEQSEAISVLELKSKDRNLKIDYSNHYRGPMECTIHDGSKQILLPEEFIAENQNRFEGWVCWVGLEQIVISQDGDVFRAWCAQDWLGNINTEVKFPKQPVICNTEMCHCNLDLMVSKQQLITN